MPAATCISRAWPELAAPLRSLAPWVGRCLCPGGNKGNLPAALPLGSPIPPGDRRIYHTSPRQELRDHDEGGQEGPEPGRQCRSHRCRQGETGVGSDSLGLLPPCSSWVLSRPLGIHPVCLQAVEALGCAARGSSLVSSTVWSVSSSGQREK